MNTQPSEWKKIIAADGFTQISTTGKKVKTKDCTPTGKYPVVDQGQGKISGYVDDSEKLISVTEPLIVFGDHTRAVKWIDFSFVPGADGTKILKAEPYFIPRFAYLQLRSLEIPNKGYSRHFKFLKELEFSVPPIAEQKVIADKLDTLLAQVETTQARLERIPQILKRFRQSVLAAAVSGKLTNMPRESFETVPVEKLAKQQKYSLGIGPFGSNLKVSDYRKAGHPLVFVREIRAKHFGDDATKYVSDYKFEELKAHRVKPGDILITKMGDPPGDVAIYPLNRPEAVITADCIKLSVDESIYCRDYVAYAMQAEHFRRDVLSISAGVAQQKVNLTKFRKLTLQVPSKVAQTEIVRRVDKLFAHADRIEQQANNALTRVNNLTQSILAKAFRGELTEQWRKDNPELISGENSAEALLERIQAERAAAAGKKKPCKVVKKAADGA